MSSARMHLPRMYVFSKDFTHKSKYVIIYQNDDYVYCKAPGSKKLVEFSKYNLDFLIDCGRIRQTYRNDGTINPKPTTKRVLTMQRYAWKGNNE